MPTSALVEFEAKWKFASSPPDVFAFMTERKLVDVDQKLPLILLDQRLRWHSAAPLAVEDYLGKLPGESLDEAVKLQLIVNEYRLRKDSSKAPSVDEFVTRFSDVADTLRTLLLTEQTLTVERVGEEKTLIENAPAELVGRYRLGRVLGQGTFGCVFLGSDEELQRSVAVKVPNPERFEEVPKT